MNTLLETLPLKEKDLFKQVITFYDDKKFKKSLKLLNKLIEINPIFTGLIIRVFMHEGTAELLYRKRKMLQRKLGSRQRSRLKKH